MTHRRCIKKPSQWTEGPRIARKCVKHHANLGNPTGALSKSSVHISAIVPKVRNIYLKPLVKPTRACCRCLLVTTSLLMLCLICVNRQESMAFHTNHSLRVTSALKIVLAGADGQLIMERTGHRSVDGVRSYKRTSEDQEQVISDILGRSKRPRSTMPLLDAPSPSTVPLPASTLLPHLCHRHLLLFHRWPLPVYVTSTSTHHVLLQLL